MESPASQPIWTAARCNRLLRPLSSKLAQLRKQLPPKAAEGDNAKVELKPSISNSDPSVQATSSKEVVCEESAKIDSQSQDLEPSPRPRKRVRRTYSCRETRADFGKRAVKSTYTQSKIELPIRIPSYRYVEDQQSQQSEFPDHFCTHLNPSSHGSSNMNSNALRQHLKFAYPDRWKLIEGIHNGLDALLKATADGVKPQATGSRTLFSACLRKIPDYIAVEETWCKEEDPESTVNISSAIYNDLEALGVSSEGGWKPLREVVRAHGIALLGAALKDGVITSRVARGLVKLCIAHSAFDEGQQLIEYMIGSMERLAPPANIRSSLLATSHLGMLDYFARISGRYAFQYHKLTQLFSNGLLPLEWMSTHDMIPCWNRLLGSLAEGDDQVRGAAVLLRTVLSLSYGVSSPPLSSRIHTIRLGARDSFNAIRDEPSCRSKTSKVNHPATVKSSYRGDSESEDMVDALHSTSSHLLTIVTTLDFLQTSAAALKSNQSSPATVSVVRDIAFEAHQAQETTQLISNPRRMCLPLLAAAIVITANDKDGVELDQDVRDHLGLIELLKPGDDFADTAASFICATVNCCEQAGSSEAFHYTQRIINGLTQTSTCQSRGAATRRFSGKIAVAAAVQFSKLSSLPKHLSWALDLEAFFNSKTIAAYGQTPIKPSIQNLTNTKRRFRWEEGICEWVAGTPVIPMPKPIVYKQQDNIVPNLNNNGREPVTQKSSLFKPSPWLLELSPLSIKFNSAVRTCPEVLEKLSSDTFLRVEIDNSHAADARKVHGCTTAKENSKSIHLWEDLEMNVDELSTPESSQQTVAHNDPTLDMLVPRVECGKTRGWKRRLRAGRGEGSWGSTESPGQALTLSYVEAEVQSVESEDELSF